MSRSPCVACVREWISIISLSQRACFAALQSQRRKKKKRESERETRRSDQRAAIVRCRPRCSSSLSRSPPALHASRARSLFPVGVKHSTSSARPSGEIRKGNRPWARSSPGEKQKSNSAADARLSFLLSFSLPTLSPLALPVVLAFFLFGAARKPRAAAFSLLASRTKRKGQKADGDEETTPCPCFFLSLNLLSFLCTPPLPNKKRNSTSAPRAAFSTSQSQWARSPSASARSSTPSPPSSRP